MNLGSAAGSKPARRRRQLQAMGIQPWRLRRQFAGEAVSAEADGVGVGCIAVLPAGCDTRIRDLLARALQAGGPSLARTGCVSMDVMPASLALAGCYLVLDQALEPQVLAQQPHAGRYVLASPQQLLTAAGKRQLWQSLRAIRSRLRAGGAA